MAESLVKHGECTADQLEQFCNGFSQSSSRFLMVDTGSNDNTALEKVKGKVPPRDMMIVY